MAWHEVDVSTESYPTPVRVAGVDIMMVAIDGGRFAVEDRCSHAGCSFSSDGEIDGATLICNCHGSEFDVRTGAVLSPPASEPLRTFLVRETHRGLEVEL